MIVESGPSDNKQKFEITIPKNKRIGVMLSSGADSAILLYLLCVELMKNSGRSISEITYIFTVPKTDGAELHSANIVNWINETLGIRLPQPTIFGAENVQSLHHSMQVHDSITAIYDKYNPERTDLFIFLADQKAVPKPWIIDGVYPFRVEENPYPDFIGLPFNDLDKSHTIDLHHMFKTEPLLVISHSCTQKDSGRCGKCYHCLERQWAFDRLGKTDPGVN
jgi:7-cyano-7-deazaguanine synthase in queuosine biosynthesis